MYMFGNMFRLAFGVCVWGRGVSVSVPICCEIHIERKVGVSHTEPYKSNLMTS